MVGEAYGTNRQAARIHRVDGDAAHGEHVGEFVRFVRAVCHRHAIVERIPEAHARTRHRHPAGKPDETLASRIPGQIAPQHLHSTAQILHQGAAVKRIARVGARRSRGLGQGRHIALALGGGKQHLGVRGESLDQAHLGIELEDRHGRAGLHVFEETDQLLAHCHLRFDRRIHGVEQQNNGGVGVAHRRVVGEGVGRQLRRRCELAHRGFIHRVVLADSPNDLGFSFFRDAEVRSCR